MLRFALVGNVIPIVIATASGFGGHDTLFFVGALGACLAPVGVTVLTRSRPIPFYLAAYGGLVSLTMLQANSGGAASGYSILTVMPMIWFGIFATDRELAVGAGLLVSCAFLPMLVVGTPEYPMEWGHAALLVIVGSAVAASLRAFSREAERLTSQLRREAAVDLLTGLMNRRGWEAAAELAVAAARRNGQALTLVMADLDHLKEVNDSGGHAEGDRALCEVADLMRGSLRASDVLGRRGGDEFVALLVDAETNRAVGAVARAQERASARARFSAGIAQWDRAESVKELVRRADVALYAAKAGGDGGAQTAA